MPVRSSLCVSTNSNQFIYPPIDRFVHLSLPLTSHSKTNRGFPNEFSIYVNYTRSLRFDDKPDYPYLRKLFRDLFIREGFQYDYVFDWTVYKLQQQQKEQGGSGNVAVEDSKDDVNQGETPLDSKDELGEASKERLRYLIILILCTYSSLQ